MMQLHLNHYRPGITRANIIWSGKDIICSAKFSVLSDYYVTWIVGVPFSGQLANAPTVSLQDEMVFFKDVQVRFFSTQVIIHASLTNACTLSDTAHSNNTL